MEIQDNIQLLLPPEYIKRATALARKAQHHIYLVSLSIIRDDATNEFLNALLDASRRGVDVHVAADMLTFVYTFNGHWLPFFAGRDTKRTDKLRNEFKHAGAKFYWLGQQYVPFLFGRTHSKWCVIDDDVFTFGGVNIERAGIAERTDYMFQTRNADLAARLIHEQHSIERANLGHSATRNHAVDINLGTLLLDGGQLGQSIIYERAISLVKRAIHVIFVSQYCPSGALGKAIDNTDSLVYFNHKNNAGKINKIMIGNRKMLSHQNNLYTRDRYIHAKFIIATLPDGSRRAISGSHNFASAGAHAGTREIALETSDPRIIDQLQSFYEKYIK